MAPCFEGNVQPRKQAWVGFLLMPHLVTDNHAWAPQGHISIEGVHRRDGGVLASLTMPTCMQAYVRDRVFLEVRCDTRGASRGCGCIDVYYCRQAQGSRCPAAA